MITPKRYDVLKTIAENGFRKKNISSIYKRSSVTFAHTVNVVKELCEKGLITKSKDGRNINVDITEKGKDFYLVYRELERLWG